MSGSRKTLSRKKKVKILQLYEPKIEEPGNRKQSKKQRDLKNLSNQVKSKFNYFISGNKIQIAGPSPNAFSGDRIDVD